MRLVICGPAPFRDAIELRRLDGPLGSCEIEFPDGMADLVKNDTNRSWDCNGIRFYVFSLNGNSCPPFLFWPSHPH